MALAARWTTQRPQLRRAGAAQPRRPTASRCRAFWIDSPGPSLPAIAEMRRAAQADTEPFLGFGGRDPFEVVDRQFAEMDAQFDRMFRDMDATQRQLDAELARSLRGLAESQPGVNIERREERSPGSYRYYESIQIRSGQLVPLAPATSHAPPLFSPLLFAALMLAGAWAALTAAFARNFGCTTFKASERWRLLATWPLLLFSAQFRAQFSSALRGENVRVLDSLDEPGPPPQRRAAQEGRGARS